jgi:thymidylate kinase
MKNKIITFIGIDGCGKSSLTNLVNTNLKESGQDSVVVWACLRPVLLRPFILLAKYLLVRQHNKFDDYKKHMEVKQAGMKKLSWTHNIYFIVMLIDYIPQVIYKVHIPFILGKHVICDRYYHDLMLDYGTQTNAPLSKILSLVAFSRRLFPEPDLLYFLKIPCEIALQRKSDIPSLEYLEERDKKYQAIANELDAKELDGTSPLSVNSDIILNDIFNTDQAR